MASHDRVLTVIRFLKLAGLGLTGAGLLGASVSGILALASPDPSWWQSLLAWILLPAVVFLGLMVAAMGFWGERRRLRQLEPNRSPPYPSLDLNRAGVRRRAWVALICGFVIVAGIPFSAYRAYHFTESDSFCATACHVMGPERTTHHISPHARVRCSQCHVGNTPQEYLEAKLFGLKELYLLLAEEYPKPIPTPITMLQPVRENCTGCHWEEQYWGKVHRDYSHFIASSDNQLWTLKMNVKVGGGYRLGDEGEGIHWHMKLGPRVLYAATDRQLQTIPWVKVITESGEEVVYESTETPLSDEELAQYEVREMTCSDCHNRPAHQFKAPILALDDAMARGLIDPDLPGVKAKGAELLVADYQIQTEGAAAAREGLLAFYQEQHPELYEAKRGRLEKAAETLASLYRQNFFPEMKADWRSYPDNIGHFLSDGCFRCHDGQHVDSAGNRISDDCSLCHEIVQQGPPGELESSMEGLPFRHPIDMGFPIRELGKCTDCHDGSLGQ